MASTLYAVCVLLLFSSGSSLQAVSVQDVDLGVLQNGQSTCSLNLKCPELPPRSCKDVKDEQSRPIVTLSDGNEVVCDTETDGGGWVVFQRRVSGDQDFYLNWTDYKYGFGNFSDSFWLGLEKIHRLTTQRRHQLRVDITFNRENYFAEYSSFKILGEEEKYQLQVGGYSGNAGDSLIAQHNGMAFSTRDRANDLDNGLCSSLYTGAWWYDSCHSSNLNGLWGSKEYGVGLTWFTKTGFEDTATFTEMKIRPIT